MWNKVAALIIKFRLVLILTILAITGVMAYFAASVEMSYDLARTVPPSDPEMVFLTQFKKQFGEDANVVGIGIKDSAVYKQDGFQKLRQLSRSLRALAGVNGVLGITEMKVLVKDTSLRRFKVVSLFPEVIASQHALDSLLGEMGKQKFYSSHLFNPTNGATLLLVSVNKEYINSAKRIGLTRALEEAGKKFSEQTGVELHYAGLPFIRTVMATKVRQELQLFLYLSAAVTGLIMFLFFRSVRAVLFSMLIIGIVVVWVLGSIALFGFKITLLSGLIPPVIVTIGITNAIYLLNKYHVEYFKVKNKGEALSAVVKKMGLATFLTNLTVAIGFLTLLSTDITLLREFGIVAGLNILTLFVVSLVMIPAVFSWLPEPKPKHLRHLQFKALNQFLHLIDISVHRYRPVIYIASGVLGVVALMGMWQLRAVTFMADDVPASSHIGQDLKFFEKQFSGIMPLEIEVDTHKKRGVMNIANLQTIAEFEQFIDSLPKVSRPVSIISLIKAARQAYYANDSSKYALPSKAESIYLLRYMKGAGDQTGLLKSFVDSSYTKMRISMQMADMGSVKMDSLVHKVIEPRMAKIFEGSGLEPHITGTTKLFIKGNKFLIDNLTESLLLAFVLITLSMVILFSNPQMIIISLVPNLLALVITAGLMGYCDIPLKASTALIFSITFGISVDNSIRFLAKYRQEQLANHFFVAKSVSESIHETGKSIVYTSVVLFAGFILFVFSSFGGTIALGLLTSVTLVISMFTNLILLPALIMTFDKSKTKKNERLLIDEFESNFYGEEEDRDIDLTKIRIHDRSGSAE